MLTSDRIKTTVSSRFQLKTYPLVEPGTYEAVIESWKIVPIMFCGPKLVIQCAVTVEDEITNLALFCNIKFGPDNLIKPPGPRSHLHKLMTTILPSDSPDRDLDDLIGQQCLAAVETSDKDENRKPKPVSQHFSVIRMLKPATHDNGETLPF
jgi:hypothetical protein